MVKMTLRAARTNKGLTQAQAADEIGVSEQTIRNWECGAAFPRGDRLDRIVEVYGIPFDALNFRAASPVKPEESA